MDHLDIPVVLLLAVAVGYLLGSLPVAVLVSRMRGVDIFVAGTGLAGSANVFRSVGRAEGAAVFLGDLAKSATTIFVSYRLGLGGQAVLAPPMAAILGHWHSVFTRFRGGDGLSPLIGMTLAFFPALTVMSVGPGLAVAAVAKLTGHNHTLWGFVSGYGFFLGRAAFSDDDLFLALGVVALALTVLGHVILSHHRRAAPA